MSAHSYSLTSPAQTGASMDDAHVHGSHVDGRHVFNSGTTHSSRRSGGGDRRDSSRGGGSGSGSGQRRGVGGNSGGGGNSGSFGSSRYNDVYREEDVEGSSVASETPQEALETYYSEQPSGRHLLDVLPQGHSRESGSGSRGSGRGSATGSGSRRGRGGSAGGGSGSGRGVSQASPSLGSYREAPSGRALVQSSSEYDDSHMGDEADDEGTVVSSQVSEDSSAWNDTDAQSAALSYGGGGGYGGGLGMSSGGMSSGGGRGGAFASGSRSLSQYTSGGTVASGGAMGEGLREARSSPVVREVELYEEDLSVSEGSAVDYGSEMTYGQDTAAGSSMVSYGFDSGAGGARGARDSGSPGHHERPALDQNYGTSGSSLASRVQGPASALGLHRNAIPNHDSWRNSPVGGLERMESGDTTDSSALEQQARERDSGQSREDGDFGTVWLANRAHARQFDGGGT